MGEGLALAALLTLSQQKDFTNDEQYNKAIKTAALAAFAQSGLKHHSDKELKKYEEVYKRVTPNEMQAVLGYGFWVYKTIQDGKITVTWSF